MKTLLTNLYRSLTVRIILLITAVFSVSLIAYNSFVLYQGSKIFNEVYTAELSEIENAQGAQNSSSEIDDFGVPATLDYAEVEAEATNQLRTQFLQDYLIVPFVIAVLVGWLIARMVTKPHRQLNKAMRALSDTTNAQALPRSSVREFDSTIMQFNALSARLSETEKLRRDMVADVSHELRTPLTSAGVTLHGMIDGVVPKSKDNLASIQTELGKLQQTVDQFEDFIEQQRQLVAFSPQEITLKNFCQKTIGSMLRQANITLQLNMSKDYKITADKAMLSQLLTNLASNTIAYAEAKTVTITADELSLTFADDGKGVPKKHLRHLFERFYRIDKSRNREYGGIGLGLAIVKQIADRHGWHIAAKSEPEKGLEIYMNLNSESSS